MGRMAMRKDQTRSDGTRRDQTGPDGTKAIEMILLIGCLFPWLLLALVALLFRRVSVLDWHLVAGGHGRLL